jgi:hypothetical protein
MANLATLHPPVKPAVNRPVPTRRTLDPDRQAAIRELISVRAAQSACTSLIRNAEDAGDRRLTDDLLVLSLELARQATAAWDRAYPAGRTGAAA